MSREYDLSDALGDLGHGLLCRYGGNLGAELFLNQVQVIGPKSDASLQYLLFILGELNKTLEDGLVGGWELLDVVHAPGVRIHATCLEASETNCFQLLKQEDMGWVDLQALEEVDLRLILREAI